MEHRLIPTSQHNCWDKALEDIYYTYAHRREYCAAMEKSSGQETFLYVAEGQGLKIACTLSLREKEPGYPELVSPYGMGGMVIAPSAGNLNGFRDKWIDYGRENGFVTCYIMQHPLFPLSKEVWGDDLFEHHIHYVVDLTLDIDDLWDGMSKTHRYEIRRLENDSNVEIISEGSDLEKALLELYPQTLERVGASQVYKFSASTLKQLANVPDSLLFGVKDGAGIQAVALFLYTPWMGDYFLNASTAEGRKYTRLLVWKAIEALKCRNISALNLGGGVRPGDPLDQFKSRFGGRKVQGQSLKQIFNLEKYIYLCGKYCITNQKETAYFPPYWRSS